MAMSDLIFKIVKYPVKALTRRRWECPICGYVGPFFHANAAYGERRHVGCQRCKCFERHRLQKLVLDRIVPTLELSRMTMLHVAPEPFFTEYFRPRVGRYETADIEMEHVDHRIDLRSIPFEDASYDLVYASHVLEHIDDDVAALGEIRRILRPGGLAILPVPILQESTIEYPQPNPLEVYHVRAPGLDYFEKYRAVFQRVDVYSSDDFPHKYQTYIYENRMIYPTTACPHRRPMPGRRHRDFVPVCYA
jgi:predicted SAM-dependent methyltransferase